MILTLAILQFLRNSQVYFRNEQRLGAISHRRHNTTILSLRVRTPTSMGTSCCNYLLISLSVKWYLKNTTDINMATLQSQKFSCQNPTSSTNTVHLLHKGLFNLKRQEDFQDSFTLPEKYKYKLVSKKSEVRINYLLPHEFYVSIGTSQNSWKGFPLLFFTCSFHLF